MCFKTFTPERYYLSLEKESRYFVTIHLFRVRTFVTVTSWFNVGELHSDLHLYMRRRSKVEKYIGNDRSEHLLT